MARPKAKPQFVEFFAGGGMAKLGLGEEWACVLANDINPMKAETYAANHGSEHLVCGDITNIAASDITAHPVLAWGSFPCQDLSLAGNYEGLQGQRSGLFWQFWRIVEEFQASGRQLDFVILENVYGTITSRGGKDLMEICKAVASAGYRFCPLVIDAAEFLPHSRPRLFVVCVHESLMLPETIISTTPVARWTPRALRDVMKRYVDGARDTSKLMWLNLPAPPARNAVLADIIEDIPVGVKWHTAAETERLISMMSKTNREKLDAARISGGRAVGAGYRRTRVEVGTKIQRFEVRFDGIAGCLRTPAGGSSRQILVIVDGKDVRTRLLSPREAARLFGIADDYILPKNYNDAYHIMGDGVAVPVVRWIECQIVQPIRRHQNGADRTSSDDEQPLSLNRGLR